LMTPCFDLHQRVGPKQLRHFHRTGPAAVGLYAVSSLQSMSARSGSVQTRGPAAWGAEAGAGVGSTRSRTGGGGGPQPLQAVRVKGSIGPSSVASVGALSPLCPLLPHSHGAGANSSALPTARKRFTVCISPIGRTLAEEAEECGRNASDPLDC